MNLSVNKCNLVRSVFSRFNLANTPNNVNILRGSPTTIQTVPHSERYSLQNKNHVIEKYHIALSILVGGINYYSLIIFYVKAVYFYVFYDDSKTFSISMIRIIYDFKLFFNTKFRWRGMYPLPPPWVFLCLQNIIEFRSEPCQAV